MTDTLKDIQDLAAPMLREQAFVAGQWVSGSKDKKSVTNPANGDLIGHVPCLTVQQVNGAVGAAKNSWPEWRAMRADERASILHCWDSLIRENSESLAALMTLEQGKPINEAKGEIEYARSFIGWFAEEAKRQYGNVIPSHLDGSRLFVQREPIGIVAAVTPWNFPCAMVTRKAAAAMAAGCPVIVVPSGHTPFSATALALLAERAGVPAGIFSVLTGDSREIVPVLCRSDDVRALSFTGSTEIGRLLIRETAESVKKVSLELGGHAPFIVFEDANLDDAVDGCINAKFATSGQDCLGANRIYVHSDIYDEFADKFSEWTATLRVGAGWDCGVDIGPLMHASAVEKCDSHVADALAKGATLLHEGGVKESGSLFYSPIVIGDVLESMQIYRDETFGPIAPLIRFDDNSEIIGMANDTIYGLAAYIYTTDVARGWKVADALEYGMVALNTPKMTGAPIPFGGYKQSGLGREGSQFGLDEFTEMKYFCWGGE